MEKIWIFWDNVRGKVMPPYIELCLESIHRHCGNDFDIHLVTTGTVKQFLPNISDSFFQIAQINNKSNYLRYHLLQQHGGIWLDADLVLFHSLKPLIERLSDNIDLVATASPGLKYGEPECGILISKPNGKVITRASQLIDHNLGLHPPGHVFKWGGLGPAIIRQAVAGLPYHHLDSKLIQPVASWNAYLFEGIEDVNKYCDCNAFGVMLFGEMFRQSNSPFLSMSKEKLLNSGTLLGSIFRRSLNNV